jgi:hypothetical protein
VAALTKKQSDFEEILERFPDKCILSYARTDEDGKMVAVFEFSKTGFGFGEIAIVITPDGRAFIDGETMRKKTLLGLFEMMIDGAILDSDTDPERHLEYNRAMGVRSCGCCGYSSEEDRQNVKDEEEPKD